MKVLEKIKQHYHIISLVVLVMLFFRQCGINRDIDKLRKDYSETTSNIDSIYSEIKGMELITESEIRENMNKVMFEYLIYEEDLDKGKISLSEIRSKIDSNEK